MKLVKILSEIKAKPGGLRTKLTPNKKWVSGGIKDSNLSKFDIEGTDISVYYNMSQDILFPAFENMPEFKEFCQSKDIQLQKPKIESGWFEFVENPKKYFIIPSIEYIDEIKPVAGNKPTINLKLISRDLFEGTFNGVSLTAESDDDDGESKITYSLWNN